jgi:PhnB protein
MSTQRIPDGPRIIPYLIVRNAAKAIDFYTRAFGAELTTRFAEPGGRIGHAEMAFAGGTIMLADEHPEMGFTGPETRGGATSSLTVYVEDVDAAAARAVAGGATLERPIQDEFYGERVARLRDPFGHLWTFHTRIEEVTPEEMQRRFAKLVEAGEAGA